MEDKKIVISAKRDKIKVLGHMLNKTGDQRTFDLATLIKFGYVKLNQSGKPELVPAMALNLALYEVGESAQAEKPVPKPVTENKGINITGTKPQKPPKPTGGSKK
jgi:acyl-CoA hydrolase